MGITKLLITKIIEQLIDMPKKIKITIFILFLFSVSTFAIFAVTSFNGQNFVKKLFPVKISSLILTEAYRLRATIDPSKFNYDRLFSANPSSLNITVSRQDITRYNDQIRLSLSAGFHGDEWKKWRKVDLQIGSKKFDNIKMKLHGTSTTPIRQSYSQSSFFVRLAKKIGFIDQMDYGLGEIGASFKIKLNSSEFYNGIRSFTLISSEDDWSATSIALTKMAKELGSIVSVPELYQVSFNGSDAGIYLLSEDISKELLERNYGITNYGMIKSNDVWDKALGIPHVSMTDYTSHDKEQSGSALASEFALGRFEVLMRHLSEGNLTDLSRLIDLEDFARFSAFEQFYGTNHSSAGDNLRYLYDFSTGKFRLVLRIEGVVVPRAIPSTESSMRNALSNLTGFDDAIADYSTNKIFKLLLNNKDFHRKRQFYLDYITKHQSKLLSSVSASITKIKALSKKTSKDTLKKTHYSIQGFNDLVFNISEIQKYLDYQKIYVSHVLNSSSIEIINESSSYVTLLGIEKCNNELYEFKEKVHIAPNYFKEKWYKSQIIKIPRSIDCIKKVRINRDTKPVKSNSITINRRRDSSIIELSFDELNELFDGNVKRLNVNEWAITKGNYKVNQTIVLPYGVALNLQPGVNIKLGPNVGFLIQGDLIALGGQEKIEITSFEQLDPFSTLAILGSKEVPNNVKLDNFHISGGNEGIINGVYYSGQMSIHHAIVKITNSQFSESISDDGLNIKYSEVSLTNNRFINNFGDQFDCDACNGEITNNVFSSLRTPKIIDEGTDGLDVSTSEIIIRDNKFDNFTDKAISVGEQSDVTVKLNIISNSNIGIAVKDGSVARLLSNKHINNKTNVSEYVKKNMYSAPQVIYQ
jgi:hypothetical protein